MKGMCLHSRKFSVLIAVGLVLLTLLGVLPQYLFSSTWPTYNEVQSKAYELSNHSVAPISRDAERGVRVSGSPKFFNRVLFEYHSESFSSYGSFFLTLNLPSRSIWIPVSRALHKKVLVVKIDEEIQELLVSIDQDTLDMLQNFGLKIRLAQMQELPTEIVFSEKIRDVQNADIKMSSFNSRFVYYRANEIARCSPATLSLCALQNSSLSSLVSIFDEFGSSVCLRSSDAGILTIYNTLSVNRDSLSANFVYFTQRNSWHCPSRIEIAYESSETYFWFNPMVQFHTMVEISKA